MNDKTHQSTQNSNASSIDKSDKATPESSRREILKKIAKGAVFAAPATMALMSTEAKACSFSC